MAAPNLVNVTSIYGKTHGQDITTSLADVVTCAAEKVLKINSIICSNIDGTNSYDVSVTYYQSSNTGSYKLAHTMAVPADSTLIVLGKDSPIYLREGDKIKVQGSAASDGQIIVSYDEMDDA